MMVFLTEPQDALRAWLIERIGYTPTPHMICMGNYNADTEKLAGVVGFDNWSGASVEMHVAGDCPGWCNRELLFKVFAYPFLQGGLNVAIIRVSSGNAGSLKFVKKVGFKEQCRIPNAWDGGYDMVILAMQKDECRWLDIRPLIREAA